MPVYILDSNFFIQAHRLYYPLDVVESFWNKVAELANVGKIMSVDKVKNEIYDHQDALTHWCKAHLADEFFMDTADLVQEYTGVAAWAVSRNGHYVAKAIAEFLHADCADAWISAYALADKGNRIVVTYEVSAPMGKNKIKIPDCCAALGVHSCTPIDMFRQLGERF